MLLLKYKCRVVLSIISTLERIFKLFSENVCFGLFKIKVVAFGIWILILCEDYLFTMLSDFVTLGCDVLLVLAHFSNCFVVVSEDKAYLVVIDFTLCLLVRLYRNFDELYVFISSLL